MSSATPSSSESPATLPGAPPLASRGAAAVWTWALIACVLLGASGVVRAMQDRRHQSEKAYKETCPIDVAKIPDKFGDDWKLIKGGDRRLDPFTMRITGGTDQVIRTYANESTGVYLTILVLFGPAEPVLPHTPEACYPASGFGAGDAPMLRPIAYSLGNDDQGKPIEGHADFLMATYSKPNGRQTLREAVYHSFRLDGQWSPFIGRGRKFPRRNPGIFKVQIHRLVGEGENVGPGDPIEQFLQKFVTEIEAEIKATNANAASK